MFPAERMASSSLFEDAWVTPVSGGTQRTIRLHFTNEDSPSSFGNVVVVNDKPTADVLSTELEGNAKITEGATIERQSGETYKVSKIGPNEDGFTQLDLRRND